MRFQQAWGAITEAQQARMHKGFELSRAVSSAERAVIEAAEEWFTPLNNCGKSHRLRNAVVRLQRARQAFADFRNTEDGTR